MINIPFYGEGSSPKEAWENLQEDINNSTSSKISGNKDFFLTLPSNEIIVLSHKELKNLIDTTFKDIDGCSLEQLEEIFFTVGDDKSNQNFQNAIEEYLKNHSVSDVPENTVYGVSSRMNVKILNNL